MASPVTFQLLGVTMRQLSQWTWFGRLAVVIIGLLSISARPTSATTGDTYLTYLPALTLDNWHYVVNEDFEGQWPNPGWTLSNNTPNYLWGRRDCRPASGHYSAWLMGAGTLGTNLPCGNYYQRGMQSWMRFGPFSLAEAEAAEFNMRLWFYGGQDDVVSQMASTDGSSFAGSGYYGSGNGFFPVHLDLSGYAGADQVWIAVYFYSPQAAGESRPEGAYVDDLTVRWCATNCQSVTSASSSNALTAEPISAVLPAP